MAYSAKRTTGRATAAASPNISIVPDTAPSTQTNASLIARREAAVARGVVSAAPIFAKYAELWDVEGKRYTDFAGGIAVLNTGRRHPGVIAAAKAQ